MEKKIMFNALARLKSKRRRTRKNMKTIEKANVNLFNEKIFFINIMTPN